jgi:hypothetical protein
MMVAVAIANDVHQPSLWRLLTNLGDPITASLFHETSIIIAIIRARLRNCGY